MDEETTEFGHAAYTAYLSFPGAPMPAWDELSPDQQEAFAWFGVLMAEHEDRVGAR